MPDKTYKERNGTTRVGDALRWLADTGKKVAPEILNVAGTVTGIDGLNKLGEKINGSKDLSDFDKKMLNEQIELDKQEMKSISKRWQSDMTSDSWLSKNIRPIALAFLTISLTAFIVMDSSGTKFNINESWINLLKNLLITVYVAYFGSRGAEKFKSITKK